MLGMLTGGTSGFGRKYGKIFPSHYDVSWDWLSPDTRVASPQDTLVAIRVTLPEKDEDTDDPSPAESLQMAVSLAADCCNPSRPHFLSSRAASIHPSSVLKPVGRSW